MKIIPTDAAPPVRLLASLQQLPHFESPAWVIKAPGREMWIAGTPHDSHEFYIGTLNPLPSTARFDYRSAKLKRTVYKRPLPDWARYAAGVVLALMDDGLAMGGFQAVFLGDEPAGPRYDFSVGVAFAAFCHEMNAQPYSPAALLDLTERVRRDFLGG